MTNKTLSEVETKKNVVVDVIRIGDKITIPEQIDIDEAIRTLQRRRDYENQEVAITRVFETFVWDGAQAFSRAMEEKYGWAMGVSTFNWFEGMTPPQMMSVAVGFGKTKQVPWGRFALPGVDGWVETGFAKKDGRYYFKIAATVKRRHEREVQELGDLTQKLLDQKSIYKGTAIKIRFRDDDGDVLPMPEPKFMDVSGAREEDTIFSDDVNGSICTNLYAPLEYREGCEKVGIPFKRGVLLAGPFGTGKTLVAMVSAKKAVDNKVTFIYCLNADDFAETVDFAKQYAPALVFCEDIDRVLSGERTKSMDDILNIVDGIDSKKAEVMVVLTTNKVRDINPAMLRPGRLDAVINVQPPNAKAVERLIRMYGRGLIAETENLSLVGKKLEGQIPSVIREAVERSKLSAIRINKGVDDLRITGEALLDAATTMKMQLELLDQRTEREPSDFERAADVLGKHLTGKFTEQDEQDLKKVAVA